MPVKPIPDGYHTVTPYLTITGVAAIMDFVKEAFGATERGRMMRPDGTVMHAEVLIGDSVIMLGEASGEWQPMPASLHLYLPDVDAVYERALQAGATSLRPPADQFYGDRSAGVRDTAGNSWWIATRVEDVSADELTRRAAEAPG
jgi:PhnB protein